MNTDTTSELVLDPSQEEKPKIEFNRHGHRIYEPSHSSLVKKKLGISKRTRNKARKVAESLIEGVKIVKQATKARKKAEHVARKKKHDAALSGRGAKSGRKLSGGPKRPSGKEKRG